MALPRPASMNRTRCPFSDIMDYRGVSLAPMRVMYEQLPVGHAGYCIHFVRELSADLTPADSWRRLVEGCESYRSPNPFRSCEKPIRSGR